LNTYTFHIDLVNLAFLGIIFIGFSFVLQLWFTKKINRPANRFFALALTTVVLWMIRLLAIHGGITSYPSRQNWPSLQYLLALGPLIYFYVLKIIRPEYKFRPTDLLHLSPFLLQLSLMVIEVREDVNTAVATYHTPIFYQLELLLRLLTLISIGSYLYASNKLIEHFYRQLKFNEVSDRYRHELRWLKRSLAGLGLSWLLLMLYTLAACFVDNKLSATFGYPAYLLLALTTIGIAASALVRPDTEVSAQATAFKPLLPIELKQKGIWLKEVMKANLYYQDAELTLRSLAETLGMQPNDLSRIINQSLKKSFNDFINEYRVAEVIEKMHNPAYDKLTLIGIAMDSGFNSKSTFNRAFRDMTGKTPVEYKSWLKERSNYTLTPFFRPAAIISGREATPVWSFGKLNRNIMFKNYLKIAYRNLVKNKAHSFINIAGLSVGMAVAMLIGLWIWDELSFDKYHNNYDSIVRVMQNQTANGEVNSLKAMPIPAAYELRHTFANDFTHVVLSSWTNPHLLSFGNKNISPTGNYMEPDAADMLTLDMAAGTRGALKDPSSILLSQSVAKAVFGDTDPINKVLKLDGINLKVAGVYQDLPANTTLNNVTFIAPWEVYAAAGEVQQAKTNWNANSFQIFAQVATAKNIAEVSSKIEDIKIRTLDQEGKKSNPQIFLFPMSKWHLYQEFKNGVSSGGGIKYVWMFGIIGLFVLMLASINFMNLSTARSEKRAKEVGIRKSIGSLRGQLIWQFLCESLFTAALAFIAALLLVQLTLPYFNNLTGKQIGILWANPLFWLTGIGFMVLNGLLAGSYPAFYLSSFKPVKVLKGAFTAGRFAAVPRKVLTVVQFTFSVTMIIGTVVVLRQIQFAKERPAGYSRAGLIMVRLYSGNVHKNIEAIRNELLQSRAAVGIAESGNQITKGSGSSGGFNWPAKSAETAGEFATFAVSAEYGQTVGWQFIDGRDFSKSSPSDSSGLVLNQSAVAYMGLKNPVGQVITWDDKKFTILGVTKDMIVESPYDPIRPTIFHLVDYAGVLNIRFNPQISIAPALRNTEAILKKYAPGDPFDYKFVDQEYAQKFGDEERVGKLAGFFAMLSIFISCLGLFGMATFMAEQRTKEIGVRKVLGATVFNLWGLLSKDFVLLVLISLIIATPGAYYFMHNWLQNYAYHSGLSWWIFVATAIGTLFLTLLTVSYQSIKAALANPVRSLRSE